MNANGGTMNDHDVLQWELQNGIGFHNPEFLKIWESAFLNLHSYIGDFESLCDLGAGTGVWPSLCADKGVGRVVAYDRNPYHKAYYAEHGNQKVKYILDDFTEGIKGKYDVVSSIEVFEHITDTAILPFLETVAKQCRWFLFSSTPHTAGSDDDWGHVNIKSSEAWQILFEAYGFKFRKDLRAPTAWTMLFESTIAK